MELFNLSFALARSRFCMHDTDPQPGKREPDLFCNVLASVIKVAGIKCSISGNRLMEGVLNNGLLLIIIKPGGKQISGMIIDGRGQIGLYLCTVFANRQFGTILDVPLDQHHAVRLTEPFGRAVPGLFVHLHLLPAIAGFVDMTLQG